MTNEKFIEEGLKVSVTNALQKMLLDNELTFSYHSEHDKNRRRLLEFLSC